MPVMPSFHGAAATPPLGQLYLEGAGQADRAREFAVDTQLKRDQLAQQYQIAEMETATRRQALQQEAMLKSQELEYQKAYRQAQLGLQQKEIDLKEQAQAEEMRQAAAVSDARMAMQREVESLMGGGNTPFEAIMKSGAVHGPQAEVPGMMAAMINENQRRMTPAQIPLRIGEVKPAEGELGKRGYSTMVTGEHSIQAFAPPTDRSVTDIEGDPERYGRGAATYPKAEAREADRLEKKRDRLEEQVEGKEWAPERALARKAKDPKAKLTAGEKGRLEEYQAKLQELKDIEDKIAQLRASMRSPARSGSVNKVGDYEYTVESE